MATKSKLDARCTEAIETIATAMESIAESTQAIEKAQRQLNDNFLLHQTGSKAEHAAICRSVENLEKETSGTRVDFKAVVYPLLERQSETITRTLKWGVLALIVLAGGAEVLKYIGVI